MINIAEILKDCPVDTKLYSPFLGYVWFKGIRDTGRAVMIDVVARGNAEHAFYADGEYNTHYTDSEVTLFPDKDQRDWSKFKVAKPKFDITTLKPYDKVLVRDTNEGKWKPRFWGFYDIDFAMNYPYECCGNSYAQCIPYEENKHLLGTTNDCEEFYKTWE